MRLRVALLAGWLVAVLVADLAPLDRAPAGLPFDGPSATHPLGTDTYGHDVLDEVLAGGPQLLGVAALVAVLVTAMATLLGISAGLFPRLGWPIDAAADALILVPPIIGVLLVILAWQGGGLAALVVACIAFGVPYCARVLRSAAAAITASGFVEVARAGGESRWRIMLHEVLPNMLPTVLTQLGLRFTEALYVVTAMAFLQLPGVLEEGNWAVMIRQNSPGILLNGWSVAAPSVCLLITVAVVHLALDHPALTRTQTEGARAW